MIGSENGDAFGNGLEPNSNGAGAGGSDYTGEGGWNNYSAQQRCQNRGGLWDFSKNKCVSGQTNGDGNSDDNDPQKQIEAQKLDCRRWGGKWHGPGTDMGGTTGWCEMPEFTIPDGVTPRTYSESSSESYNGPSDWAMPAYQQMVNMGPGMARGWQTAWNQSQQVPDIIDNQRRAVPQQVLSEFQQFQDYTRPVNNAYAAKGMRDSSAGRAAKNDVRTNLMREYSRGLLSSQLGLDQMLVNFYGDQLGRANQAAATGTQLVNLGNVNRSSSRSMSETTNELAKYIALLQAMNG